MKALLLITSILLITLPVFTTDSTSNQPNDVVTCIKLQDSPYGHVTACSATRPLPLKVQTTVQLDQDFSWTDLSYSVGLLTAQTKVDHPLLRCFQARPAPGDRKAGDNITLSLNCNDLPVPVRQNDFIRYVVHFPNLKFLIWGVPIPGYSTQQDVDNYLQNNQLTIEAIQQMRKIKIQLETQTAKSDQQNSIINIAKTLKHLKEHIEV